MRARRPIALLTCTVAALAGAVVAAGPAAADSTVSVTDTPSAPIAVDNYGAGPTATRTLTVTTVPGAVVLGATVSVDLQSISLETCSAPGAGYVFDDELGLTLTSPDSTSVTLVGFGTFSSGATSLPRATVTFSDAAAAIVPGSRWGDASPVHPVGALASLVGKVAAGTWTLTVSDQATRDAKCYYGATLDLTVAVPPTMVGATLAAGAVGTPYSASVAATAGDTPITYAVTAGALPAGLVLDAATGAISGTPTGSGTSTFTVQATNSGGVASASYSIAVPLYLPGGALASTTVGTAYSAALSPDASITSYRLANNNPGALPAGVTLNTTTGVVSGTPTIPGGYWFRVQARVGSGAWSTAARYTLDVVPVLPGGDLGTVEPGVAFSAPLIADATGIDEFALAPQASLPDGLTLDAATGVVSGTPTTPGAYAFRVRAHAAGAPWSEYARYTLGVLPTLADAYLGTGTVGSAFSAPLTTATAGIDRFHLTNTSEPLPDGLTLDEATGVVSGTPTHAGVYTFRARAQVSGVGQSAAADFRIVVLPKLLGRALPTGTKGAALSLVLADPTGGIDRFALAPGSALPPGLSLDPLTGVLSGTPTTAGTYTFSVLAINDDAGTSVPATFTLVLAAPEELAATGTDAARTGLLALVLLGVGGALVVVRRRHGEAV